MTSGGPASTGPRGGAYRVTQAVTRAPRMRPLRGAGMGKCEATDAWYARCKALGMTFPKRLLPLAATAALPLLAACFERVDSTDVTTDGLYADVRLLSLDGVSTDVAVTLAVGGPNGTRVSLTNGDRLTAVAMGRTVDLSPREDLFGSPSYAGTLPHAGENVAVVVDYLRGDRSAQAQSCGNTSAVGSYALMTKPFELSPMTSSARLAQPVTVAWSNRSAEPMEIRVDGSCVRGGVDRVSDGGAFAIPGAWLAASDPKNPSSCSVRVQARRCATGRVSPAFGEGGRVEACQERSLAFRVSP